MKLAIKPRLKSEKAEAIRANGGVPGVFYGRKEKATSITIDAAVFAKVWRDAGETTILSLEGIGEPKDVLIHDVVAHPVTGQPEHVDFYVLEKGKKIQLSVPIEFEGVAPAEKEGGVVVKVLHEIEIEVDPKELPQHLTVDLSGLAHIGDQVTVSQVPVPQSAVLITEGDEIVVSVTEQNIEEDMPTTPPTAGEAAEDKKESEAEVSADK